MITTLPGKEDGAVQDNDGKTLWNKQALSQKKKKKKMRFFRSYQWSHKCLKMNLALVVEI